MARALQLLSSVLSRARARGLSPQSTAICCRFINKGPGNQPWAHSQRAPRDSDEMSDEEYATKDVEGMIQEVIEKQNKRAKTVKYHILRRQMTPRGPPERKLTWDAIEEVRYLKQELPEEWTVERLAEGFSVSKDVILRVLRSKFVPSTKRKVKQDIKVMGKLHQLVLPSGAQVDQEKQRLSAGSTHAVLTSGRDHALVPVGHQTPMPQNEQNSVVLSVMATQQVSEINKHIREIPQEENQPANSTAPQKEEREEDWDGQVLLEEDIERLMTTVKSTRIVKEGNEFFDRDGNFLYRI